MKVFLSNFCDLVMIIQSPMLPAQRGFSNTQGCTNCLTPPATRPSKPPHGWRGSRHSPLLCFCQTRLYLSVNQQQSSSWRSPTWAPSSGTAATLVQQPLWCHLLKSRLRGRCSHVLCVVLQLVNCHSRLKAKGRLLTALLHRHHQHTCYQDRNQPPPGDTCSSFFVCFMKNSRTS